LVALVAAERGVSVRAIFDHGRGQADIALARQLAMYLMHTHFGRLYADVGRFFGRDRTTVSHACGVIEELREAPEFDALVYRLETALLDDAAGEREARDAAA
jgi:chromosomal replication initiation ATPase DnaA